MNKVNDSLTMLLDIMCRLRDPQAGCAWDRRQDFHTIAPYTLEEAYEVVDAIERNDLDDLRDELGDLLFQVVFHAQMASEQGAFTFDDVVQSIVDKMIRRHPHVFAGVVYESEEAQKAAWELIKAEERRLKLQRKQSQRVTKACVVGELDPPSDEVGNEFLDENDSRPVINGGEPLASASALDGIARNLPALKSADKIQKRAARVGFDWPDVAPVWHKLHEEIAEVQEALSLGNAEAIQDEIGDLLFTVVNLARHCSVDAEQALQGANAKFGARFRTVEALARMQQKNMKELTLDELNELWNCSKNR